MEAIGFTVLGVALWIAFIIFRSNREPATKSRTSATQPQRYFQPVSQHKQAELIVAHYLNKHLRDHGYILFSDLIIPSASNRIKSTQIDHVIVSTRGIFCIETKSHRGNVYGRSDTIDWKQYIGTQKHSLHNPVRQNWHHAKSLEHLFRKILKAPVHSYIVFPWARKVMLDGAIYDASVHGAVRKIQRHTKLVYSLDEVALLAKALVLVSETTGQFEAEHIRAVQTYIAEHASRPNVR